MFEFNIISNNQAFYFVVDDYDRDLIENESVRVIQGYAKLNSGYLHQLIGKRMNFDLTNKEVDHINHFRWDNRRSNLRNVNRGHNAANKSDITRNNKWGYKGIKWKESSQRFRAEIGYEGRKLHIGEYRTAHEAALAYDRKAIELYGKGNVIINFPDEQDFPSLTQYPTYFVEPRKDRKPEYNREDYLYATIVEFIKTNGYSPTKAELTKIMGYSNNQTVSRSLLPKLVKKGLITYEPGRGRNIKLVA